jgi:hypothetical protein
MTVIKQISRNEYTVIILDQEYPFERFNTIYVDGRKLKPEVVYGTRDCIAVKAKGSFVGKEVLFAYE